MKTAVILGIALLIVILGAGLVAFLSIIYEQDLNEIDENEQYYYTWQERPHTPSGAKNKACKTGTKANGNCKGCTCNRP